MTNDGAAPKMADQTGAASNPLQPALSKEVAALLLKLDAGDLIEGMLTGSQGKYMLQFSKNMQIPVQLTEQMETGKLMQFEVVKKQGEKLFLKAVNTDVPMSEKVIEELELPKNETMRSLISTFAEKELPMLKKDLLKAYHMEQKYEMPAKVLANMLSGKLLNEMKVQGYENLKQQLKTLLVEGDLSVKAQQDIFKLLKTDLKDENTKRFINEILENIAKNEPESMPKDIIETLRFKGQNTSSMRSAALKTWLENYPEEFLSNKKWMGQVNEKMLLQLFKRASLKNTDGYEEETKWQNLNKTLSRLTETLKKEALSTEHKEVLAKADKTIEVLGKYEANGAYYLVPMEEKQKNAGEVYFFKPKKHGKKQEGTFYIVIALQMPALSEVQVHIRKLKQQLSIEIKVKDEAVRDFIDQYKKQVEEGITACGYTIGKVEIKLLNEKKEEVLADQMDAFYHMDLKV